MKLKVTKITQADAVDILCWKYEEPYDYYNALLTPDAMLALLGSSYYAVKNEADELIGFFCTGKAARWDHEQGGNVYDEECVDIGIGMKPELTGKGYGSEFFSFILNFVKKERPGLPLRLTVASFNKRAIRLYEKFGFVKEKTIQAEMELITMKQQKTPDN